MNRLQRPLRPLVAGVLLLLAFTCLAAGRTSFAEETAAGDARAATANNGAATAELADKEEAATASPPAAGIATPPSASSASTLAGSGVAVPRPSAVGTKVDATALRIVDRLLGEISRPEGEPRRMSLAEAVRTAVENNPGIRSQAEVPRSAAYVPFGATGAFDPRFNVNADASSTKAPAGNALASGALTFEEDAVRTGVSISKLLRSGADLRLAWDSQIVDTNSLFFQINPRYDNRLILSLRQPLLRNFWASREETTVLVARSQAEESLAAFEAQLSNFVSGVIQSYWRQVQAAAELEVSRRSVALARELVRDAEARVEVGLLAPVAVKEALADAAAREERAIVAENDLVLAGRDLQHQVMLGAVGVRAPEPILPAEEHVVTPVELDRAASLRSAVECRAEIRGASYALGRLRLEETRARNERLPVLDFVAQYGLLGLAGDAKPVVDANGNIQYSPYDGDYSDSLDTMIGNDFNDYSVGLRFEVPFGNAAARAQLAQAEINVRRASRDLEQAVSIVALDVDRALADVASATKRVTASKAARELAEENLRNQTRRFELGAVTTKDVLDFQEKLAQSQAAEVRAITDHALSLTRLRVADGTLLARFGLEIQSPDAPGEPWWYRF
ncbi:MAG: TolC family protein [Candidatus Binatia bacterium]